MESRIVKHFIPAVAGLVFFVIVASAGAYTTEECLGCHRRGGSSSRFISVTEFRHSAHGKDLSCLDCHNGIRDESHRSRPESGAVRCGQCHDQENHHGGQAGGRPSPQCHDCHTRHGILPKTDPKSSVHPERLPATCRTCHPRECGEMDMLSWVVGLRIKSHKKQDFSRDFQDTNCLGCHQGKAAHGEERPITNQTCYKCHQPGPGQSPLWGSIHPRADWKRQPSLFAAALLDQAGLGLLAAGILIFIGRKFVRTGRKRR
jgi:hypothetical protein